MGMSPLFGYPTWNVITVTVTLSCLVFQKKTISVQALLTTDRQTKTYTDERRHRLKPVSLQKTTAIRGRNVKNAACLSTIAPNNANQAYREYSLYTERITLDRLRA